MENPKRENTKKGYFLLSRSIFDSELWNRPPLYVKLFIWLLGKANHKDNPAKRLQRGQCLVTLPETIEAMKYYVGYRIEKPTKKQIWGTYEGLREADMIVTTKVTRGMVVTICNYDFYQDPKSYEGNNEGTAKVTRREQQGNTKDKNVKNEKNESHYNAEKFPWEQNGHYGAGDPGNDDDDFSLSLLTQNGISKKVAVSLVRKFSAERIAEQTEFTLERVNRGELEAEAVPAYLVRGIMEDYRAPKGFTSSMQQRKKAEAAEAAERSRKAAEAAKMEAEQKAEAQEGERAAELAAYYDALPEYEQEEIHQLVIDTIKAENSLIYGRYLQELEKGNNWDQVKVVRLVYLDIRNKILEASWQKQP